jgi:carboxymethylenebutenolidase
VLVIHENRGLNEHIEDVARRVALAGYVAIAPDGLSVAGARPPTRRRRAICLPRQDRARIATTCWPACRGWPRTRNNGKIGVVGFCYGGGLALRAAIEA